MSNHVLTKGSHGLSYIVHFATCAFYGIDAVVGFACCLNSGLVFPLGGSASNSARCVQMWAVSTGSVFAGPGFFPLLSYLGL